MSELKQIDMSVLVGSDVLCEFSRKKEFTNIDIGFLCGISSKGTFLQKNNELLGRGIYDYFCRPLLNRWVCNAEGNLKLPDGLMVEVIDRDGDKYIDLKTFENTVRGVNPEDPFYRDLKHNYPECLRATEIIAVKITGLAEGYTWSKS